MEKKYFVRVMSKRFENDFGVSYPYVTTIDPPEEKDDALLFESENKERATLVFERILKIQLKAEENIFGVIADANYRESAILGRKAS